MSDRPVTALPAIPRGPAADAALDVRALFQEGLASLRSLAGRQWTDHNTHDPGITILELACWALAELAYRSSLPIEDLILRPAAEGEDEGTLAAHSAAQFHRAGAILPNRPWTPADWRRRLIDLPGVKNAWVEPVNDVRLFADLRRRELRRDPPAHTAWQEVVLGGLHRARIEFMDHIGTRAEREAVLRQVSERLQAERNLGEDFIELRSAKAQYFAVCAEIELDAGVDPSQAAAQCLFTLSQTIAPAVPNHPLAVGLARGTPLPDLLEGPLLQHGLIDTADLAASELPQTLQLSDLIAAVMGVSGVRAVLDLRINPLQRGNEDDEAAPDADPFEVVADALPVANPWQVPVRPGRLPRLSLAQGRLVFSQRGLPVAGWFVADMPEAVREGLTALRAEARRKVETPQELEPALPLGRSRDLSGYHSFQNDFPALYGIGPEGLPPGADETRRLEVRQLQAWLLFFDQWMANHLATLAGAGRRLSVAPADLLALADGWQAAAQGSAPVPHVLGAQLVNDIFTQAPLYHPGTDTRRLADLNESADEATARQQRVLEHLLARIGEDFAEISAVLGACFGTPAAQRIAQQCRFLAEAAELGGARAGAQHQYPAGPEGVWNTTNVSTLERRLARLLGLADFSRRSLSAVSHDSYTEVDATPDEAPEWRFRVRHAVTGRILLSASTRYLTAEAARAEMMQAIERAQLDAGIQRARSGDGRHYFNIVAADGEVLARRIQYFDDAAAMEAAIAELQQHLRERYSGEGLYLVEHLLLRPVEPDDPLLPICGDPGCDDCLDLDPYSWRLHILLPAYAGRFQNQAFRRFVEETIRRELPAHLLPTVCWLAPEDMARFERAWRDWLELHAGHSRSGRRNKLQALIDTLVSVKNVYPQRALFDCSGDETQPPFILGKTSLGRMNSA